VSPSPIVIKEGDGGFVVVTLTVGDTVGFLPTALEFVTNSEDSR
jgi:hypothetical protein